MEPEYPPPPSENATPRPGPNIIVASSPVVSPAQVFPERYGYAPLGVGYVPPPVYRYPPPLVSPYPYRPVVYPYRPYPYNPYYY